MRNINPGAPTQTKIALPQGRGYRTVFTKSSLRKLWDKTRSCASHNVKGTHMHVHTHTHTPAKETISTEQCRAHHIIDKGQKERAGKNRAEHRETETGEDTTEMTRTDKAKPWPPCHRNCNPFVKDIRRCAWNKCCEIWKRAVSARVNTTNVYWQGSRPFFAYRWTDHNFD